MARFVTPLGRITLCLACRACEPACPSGVQYGALVETMRIAIEQTSTRGLLERTIRRLALHEMMPHVGRLRFVAQWVRVDQMLGLQRLVRALNFLPKNIQAMEALPPPLPKRYPDYRQPAPAIGQQRGLVAFFHGYIQDAFLADVNAATIRALQRNVIRPAWTRKSRRWPTACRNMAGAANHCRAMYSHPRPSSMGSNLALIGGEALFVIE